MSAGTVYVTTSWDDGHRLDTRLASELAAYGVAATFYVAPRCRELRAAERLGAGALRHLSEGFEIGGHTLTHPNLTTCSDAEALREIVEGKEAVEDIIGRQVTSFCYPYGAYADGHPDMVAVAGFSSARTVDRFRTAVASDPFRTGTTTHAYRHLVDGPQIWRRTRSPRRAFGLWRHWDRLGRAMFDEVRDHGGVFHLWGHSWEIDAHDDWSRLRSVLKEIAAHDVVFVTNGELASQWRPVP